MKASVPFHSVESLCHKTKERTLSCSFCSVRTAVRDLFLPPAVLYSRLTRRTEQTGQKKWPASFDKVDKEIKDERAIISSERALRIHSVDGTEAKLCRLIKNGCPMQRLLGCWALAESSQSAETVRQAPLPGR
jgi:hypothetical protein